ncbi:MAG: thiamine phosphate synthase [Alphaproteobacteria bacterium]
MTMPVPPLLAITDRHLSSLPLPELAERLFASGVRWLSLRDKDLADADRLDLARDLFQRARPWGARITLHGDPALAAEAGVHGVHLPAGSDPVAARALLGPAAWIGLSGHDSDGADLVERVRGQVDYLTLSPVFPSASKPGYGPCLGISGLQRWAERGLPVVALGGIDGAQAVADCLAAGAAGVAVMGLAMRDPRALGPLLAATAGRTAPSRPG